AISAKRLKAKRLSAPMTPLSPASSARGRLVIGRGAVMGASRQWAASAPMATASNGPTCALMLPPETVGTTLPYSTPATPPGAYTVSASLLGQRAASQKDVRVAAGAAVSLDLVLQPLTLEAVTVTAMLREQEVKDVPFSVAAPTAQLLRTRGADNIEGIAAN